VGERFRPGDQVRARRTDPAHHTRIPRYVRGAVGTVVATEGRHPLPDLRSRGLPAEPARAWPTPTPRCPSSACRWAAACRSSG
jgi:Nitrile hydratase beta subunit